MTSQTKPISPINVSPDGRYFVDQSGVPVFWLGDTQWELFRCFTAETARPILRDRQAKGFNTILIMLTGVDHTHFDSEAGQSYTNLLGELPWIDNDPAQPNERYFQHVDTLIRLGEETGQTFVVGVYHQWHRDVVTLPRARSWARWVATRYRDVPNLIWSMYPRAEPAYVSVCRELAAGLQEGDGGAHLISVHPDPSVASSSFLHEEHWLALNMIQTCIDYEQIPAAVLSDYRRQPAKPVVMAEGGYEGVEFGRRQTAYEIRQQAYWTQLSGGYHVYGHNDAWTAPDRWRDWLNAPGSRHLSRFREIITGFEKWWTLVPDPSLISTPDGAGNGLNIAARPADREWVLAYLSEPTTVTLRVPGPVADSACTVDLINPATAERRCLPDTESDAGDAVREAIKVSTPVGWEDTLVLVHRAP